MQWLVADAQPGDSLLFHYSGHGSHYRSRDEVDGYSEVLVPVDSNVNGHVDDKFINRMLVNPLPPGVTLHAVIDACHSGSVMNLPWMVDSGYKLRKCFTRPMYRDGSISLGPRTQPCVHRDPRWCCVMYSGVLRLSDFSRNIF
eukprot:m.78676 g.78676  ORF g.78676 m.78676 type:complete len:143 (+) comp25140_c0_seq2:29-457(+)